MSVSIGLSGKASDVRAELMELMTLVTTAVDQLSGLNTVDVSASISISSGSDDRGNFSISSSMNMRKGSPSGELWQPTRPLNPDEIRNYGLGNAVNQNEARQAAAPETLNMPAPENEDRPEETSEEDEEDEEPTPSPTAPSPNDLIRGVSGQGQQRQVAGSGSNATIAAAPSGEQVMSTPKPEDSEGQADGGPQEQQPQQ